MDLVPIPRVHASDFRPARFGREPRVVIDNVRNWKALDRWQPDYLKSVVGDREVAVRETQGPPRNIYQKLTKGGRISFSQYLDWVVTTAHADDLEDIARRCTQASEVVRAVCASGFEYSYYLDVKLTELSRQLLDDTEIPSWYDTVPEAVIFWCGVLGTSCGLHSDVTPNCNVQIVGRKQFILFPPSQSRLLYRIPRITHCRFDPNIPDFDRFPLALRAKGWQCTLQAGESLYIPVGWYHQVTVTSAWALNVNIFWPRPFPQGLATPVLWGLLLRRGRAGMRRALERLQEKWKPVLRPKKSGQRQQPVIVGRSAIDNSGGTSP